jgi:hypothetical protein
MELRVKVFYPFKGVKVSLVIGVVMIILRRETVSDKASCRYLVFGILLGYPLAVAKGAAILPGVHTKHET